jgi:hypothetical protein
MSDTIFRIRRGISKFIALFDRQPNEVWVGEREYLDLTDYFNRLNIMIIKSEIKDQPNEIWGMKVRRSLEPGIRVSFSIEV